MLYTADIDDLKIRFPETEMNDLEFVVDPKLLCGSPGV
jgi:hypothetical protein